MRTVSACVACAVAVCATLAGCSSAPDPVQSRITNPPRQNSVNASVGNIRLLATRIEAPDEQLHLKNGNVGLYTTLANGGTSYCSPKADLSTLFEDFSLARPTMASLVPRVCELFHHHFLAEHDRRVAAGLEELDHVATGAAVEDVAASVVRHHHLVVAAPEPQHRRTGLVPAPRVDRRPVASGTAPPFR